MRLQVATTKPPALHDGDGYIDYGDGTGVVLLLLDADGGNRRAAISVTDGCPSPARPGWTINGVISRPIENGGWDWFSVQLEDGTDVMLYVIRGPDGETLRVDGSIVAADGELTVLRAGDFAILPTGEWVSPATGTTYPSGWHITVPGNALEMTLTPTMLDQELDTRRDDRRHLLGR